jgi:multicomponent Na+:H+ antiporter subunit G
VVIEVLIAALFILGLFFTFVGSLGVLRFEDVYLRLQASSKTLTFGFGFIVMGAGIAAGDIDSLVKAVIAVAFQVVTAPLAAQVIARAALSRGIKPQKMHRIERLGGADAGRDDSAQG